ncbi:SAM hydrolase/SAM-dependent halogenase family protein [Varunaivibrio sulfuroxidans]|uniref:SAM-dependent chlorinase/fluorinase n=1 Tax=Varunaivibrio sulfuroxidans TaxID=1773489 RepID=A0A4R3J8U5_9PROT|nr:SAM-dependent chlorinase/fluorinase [Varunaivibrio sulfuroxidans]TCS61353.1 hypothetical protein EDD55_108155 [Varunaivibrio sulfuroxidans]WES31034.1 SAM-dependent chlorinase/fluorinase [Varunaivibrio sulfuroxidans]
MIYLFCDFGLPYTAEMRARIAQRAPGLWAEDLLVDAPAHDPRLSSKVLQGLTRDFPAGSIFVCVIDPGVGGARRPLVVRCDDHWFVGPDNGLFEYPMRAAQKDMQAWEIVWRPRNLSVTFHGRDLFAPVAGRLAKDISDGGGAMGADHNPRGVPPTPWGCATPGEAVDATGAIRRPDWPDDVFEIVYFDGFGNAFTGVRAKTLKPGGRLIVNGLSIPFHRTFSDVPESAPLVYENAYGMVEIAVNGGSAKDRLSLCLGDAVQLI